MHVFRSTTLRPLAEKYQNCDEQYDQIQAGLVDKVMGIIATYAPAVEQLCELIADMDVLVVGDCLMRKDGQPRMPGAEEYRRRFLARD